MAIFAAGIMVAETLKARAMLKARGIDACVVDLVSVKPLDEETVVRCARTCGAVVTAENSNIRGGVYGAVAECLAMHCPVPAEPVGIQDEFGEVGTYEYLKERFGLTAECIVKKAEAAMARKI